MFKPPSSAKTRRSTYNGAEKCWLAAIETLILVVKLGGPTLFARIGVMRALNRHVERMFNHDRKDPHWGRQKPTRDQ
jgi:hypothetical protein